MKKSEFNEVLNIMGINNPIGETLVANEYARCFEPENLYGWNNCKFHYNSVYDVAEIRGKIPYEVAILLNKRNEDVNSSIRMQTTNLTQLFRKRVDDKYHTEKEPYDFRYPPLEKEAIDEEYLKAIDCDCGGCYDEYTDVLKKAFEELDKRPNDGKFITSYYVDNKEGLVVFLSEILDYESRKKGLPETEVDQIYQRISLLNKRLLLESVDKDLLNDWIDEQNNSESNKDLTKMIIKTPADEQIQDYLCEFSNYINPIINKLINLDEADDYFSKCTITVSEYNNNQVIELIDPKNNDYSTKLGIGDDELKLSIESRDKKMGISYAHNRKTNNEIISYRNESENSYLYYNLPYAYLVSKDVSTSVTNEQKNSFCNALNNATKFISSLVNGDINKENEAKSYVKK